MSKKLATLRSDVPLELAIEALKSAEPGRAGLRRDIQGARVYGLL